MAEQMEKAYCSQCNRTMNIDQFYLSKRVDEYPGGVLPKCKKCFTMHINNWEPSTFIPLLEIIDVPYVPAEWNVLLDRYGKDPKKTTTMAIFGRYLSKMKLKQYSDYRFADTERIAEEEAKKKQLAEARSEAYRLRNSAGVGNVMDMINVNVDLLSEEELMALFPQPEQLEMIRQSMNPTSSNTVANTNPFGSIPQPVVEPSLESQIDPIDKMKLSIKWGKLYNVEELLQMERFYRDMMDSYEIKSASHLDYLKMICKTSLKMNQAIDCSDYEGYNKLAKVYDSLMKSAKFTAAQNKTESENDYQAVCELIQMAEEQGFIPRFDLEVPKDIVDATIKDMERYLNTLVREEQGLGNLIETAIAAMKREEEADSEDNVDLDELDDLGLEDDDYADFYSFQEELGDDE